MGCRRSTDNGCKVAVGGLYGMGLLHKRHVLEGAIRTSLTLSAGPGHFSPRSRLGITAPTIRARSLSAPAIRRSGLIGYDSCPDCPCARGDSAAPVGIDPLGVTRRLRLPTRPLSHLSQTSDPTPADGLASSAIEYGSRACARDAGDRSRGRRARNGTNRMRRPRPESEPRPSRCAGSPAQPGCARRCLKPMA